MLYPIPASGVGDAAVNGLSVTVGDRTSEERLLAAVADLPGGMPDLAIHVEVETGLGRGGIGVAELGTALDRLRRAAGVRPAALWTHLQAPEDDELTVAQLALFDQAAEIARAAGSPLPRHVAASAGILARNVPAVRGCPSRPLGLRPGPG